MENPLILTFDIGTQSMRGMFINKKGEIEDLEQFTYEQPYYSINPGWAEQHPDFYYEVLCKVSKNLTSRNKDLIKRTIAVSMTSFRDSAICLDKENKPIRDLILWLDKREARRSDLPTLPIFKQIAFALVGMSDTIKMQQRQSVCNWLMTKEKETWQKTNKFVVLSSYLNYKLTGNLVDCPANQIAHLPFDYKNRRWMSERGLTRCLFDVPTEMLCDLIPSGETIGYINKETAEISGITEGLPLIATGADKSCETLGLSVNTKSKAAISFGTAATIQFSTPDYFEPRPFAPSYPSVLAEKYNPEVQIYRGYWMLSWFKSEFAEKECEEAKKLGISAEEYLNRGLKDVPAGCEGLFVQPYWGPGVVTPNARGAMIGFTDIHTKKHIYRAIIEGIGFALMEGMYTMEKRGKQKIEEIYVGGGGSQSDEICQITANMFGLPVKRIQTHEACGIGAAMVAFVAKEEFENFDKAVVSMVRTKDVFTPDEKEHKVYAKLYKEIYSKLYDKLLPFNKKIKKLTKKED
ncbi:MAG: FGGY-family carbohydrate kinase [Clostridia bacterium]|nr:FGGY-family carbohydrate kinase [Clostridia bacterium]